MIIKIGHKIRAIGLFEYMNFTFNSEKITDIHEKINLRSLAEEKTKWSKRRKGDLEHSHRQTIKEFNKRLYRRSY